jgi:hypothetical protein
MMARREAGELGPRGRQDLEEHLAGCPECAELEGEIGDIWMILGPEPSVEPSEDALRRLKEMVRAESVRAPVRRAWWFAPAWRWTALAACALLIAILLIPRGGFETGPPARNQGPAAVGEPDRWDDQFLQELDVALKRSEAEYLSTYDSWPGVTQEVSDPAAQPARRGAPVRKKESI